MIIKRIIITTIKLSKTMIINNDNDDNEGNYNDNDNEY